MRAWQTRGKPGVLTLPEASWFSIWRLAGSEAGGAEACAAIAENGLDTEEGQAAALAALERATPAAMLCRQSEPVPGGLFMDQRFQRFPGYTFEERGPWTCYGPFRDEILRWDLVATLHFLRRGPAQSCSPTPNAEMLRVPVRAKFGFRVAEGDVVAGDEVELPLDVLRALPFGWLEPCVKLNPAPVTPARGSFRPYGGNGRA